MNIKLPILLMHVYFFHHTVFKVHWVQCDKCELWYHLFCIGLKPHDIKEDEDFVCKFCKVDTGEGRSVKKRQNDTSASDMDTE